MRLNVYLHDPHLMNGFECPTSDSNTKYDTTSIVLKPSGANSLSKNKL